MTETPKPKPALPILPIAVAISIGACLGLAAAALLEARANRNAVADLRGSVRLMRDTPCAGCAEKAARAVVPAPPVTDSVIRPGFDVPAEYGPVTAGTGEPVPEPAA